MKTLKKQSITAKSKPSKIRVLIWNENVHEKSSPAVQAVYPRGIHNALAAPLRKQPDISVGTAVLEDPEHGLTQQRLDRTDVLIWWGHVAHQQVDDAVVARVRARILEGMGLIALHSAHYSKIFKTMMGTTCSLKWREAGERERLWNLEPGHPITAGLGEYFELPHTEMYGEPFGIPAPEKTIFVSWFEGGEVFRSGCIWERGNGRIFYFRPGHETYPVFFDSNVQRVILNAVRWAAPRVCLKDQCPKRPPIETLPENPGGCL